MPRIDISDEERSLLEELLVQELDMLASEVHHTDARSLKEELRQRRDLIAAILDRLQTVRVEG